MPKYLIQASYTADGIQGLLKDGGSKRRAAAEQAIKGLGGSIEAFYFAFGDTDAVVIADAPDNQTAAAVSLAVTASGAVRTKITVLMTPEEMDQATKKSVSYRAPGGKSPGNLRASSHLGARSVSTVESAATASRPGRNA